MPKPVIVIMDEPLEMQLPLTQAKDETWIYVDDRDGKRLAPERRTTGDHIDYDCFGEVTSGNQISTGERYRYAGREFDAEEQSYRPRGRCPCGANQTRPGVWLSEDGRIVAAGEPAPNPQGKSKGSPLRTGC